MKLWDIVEDIAGKKYIIIPEKNRCEGCAFALDKEDCIGRIKDNNDLPCGGLAGFILIELNGITDIDRLEWLLSSEASVRCRGKVVNNPYYFIADKGGSIGDSFRSPRDAIDAEIMKNREEKI